MKVTPYSNCDGNCEEAMRFYADCLGAEVDAPELPVEFELGDSARGGLFTHAGLLRGARAELDADPGHQPPIAGSDFSFDCGRERRELFAESRTGEFSVWAYFVV